MSRLDLGESCLHQHCHTPNRKLDTPSVHVYLLEQDKDNQWSGQSSTVYTIQRSSLLFICLPKQSLNKTQRWFFNLLLSGFIQSLPSLHSIYLCCQKLMTANTLYNTALLHVETFVLLHAKLQGYMNILYGGYIMKLYPI